MAEAEAGQSADDETLHSMFKTAMKMFETIENSTEATSSDTMQMRIKSAISKLEKATELVSLSGMFSRNENIDEVPTENLQYLLLPALLGTLTLKLGGTQRRDIIDVAEIYYRDYLKRCKEYGVTDKEPNEASEPHVERLQSEQAKIANMVLTREAKIRQYKELKELKEKLTALSKAMSSSADEETRREYFVTLLHNHVNQALDELVSIEQEKPILEYMAKHGTQSKPKERARAPLRPVIIARDAAQKAVFGAGYPALPTLTVQEYYEQRAREGAFPGGCAPSHSHSRSHSSRSADADGDADEAERERKERLEDTDDAEELARRRNMDEYKDEHRRGWGNRHNRS